jgi:hypothetical protein
MPESRRLPSVRFQVVEHRVVWLGLRPGPAVAVAAQGLPLRSEVFRRDDFARFPGP